MKKSLYYEFKETSLAVDASMAYDHMKELEKIVDYESFMRECLACESVYTTKFSSLEIPGSQVGLFDSVEQTALTRANGTLLMKAMLERQTSKMHGKKLRDWQVRKDKIVERHVHDETVRIVEKGG